MCLFPSEAVDTNPSVHTLPAAKTFSKSAAAPKNGNVVSPPSLKGPAGQNKPSYQPAGAPGTVTCCGTGRQAFQWRMMCSCTCLLTGGSISPQKPAAQLELGLLIPDTKPFEIMSSIKTGGVPFNELRLLAFPKIPLVKYIVKLRIMFFILCEGCSFKHSYHQTASRPASMWWKASVRGHY